MDQKDFLELKKLKEEKNADLLNLQALASLGISDFEDPDPDGATQVFSTESGEDSSDPDPDSPSTEERTLTFEKVEAVNEVVQPGARHRRAVPEEERKKRKRKKKNARIALISVGASLAVLLVLLVVFFAVRSANRTKYTYEYWGNGLAISERDADFTYSFFGHPKELILYDEIGQPSQKAEFDDDGNCIRETAYDKSGNVEAIYTHAYENGVRVRTSYTLLGQLTVIAQYTKENANTVHAQTTYVLEENRVADSTLLLDENGNLIKETFTVDGVPSYENQYSGHLIVECRRFKDDGSIEQKEVFEHDTKGNLLTETVYDATGAITERTSYQYNDSDLLTKTIHYDGAGIIIDYFTYNYDTEQNPIKQLHYDKNGVILDQLLRTFNDKNRVLKETSSNADGSVVYCHGYEYTEQGYVSRLITYDPQYSTKISEYTDYLRDGNGTVTEEQRFNGDKVMIQKITYDAVGYPLETSLFSDAGVLTKQTKSQYDDKQNMIRQEVSEFDETGSPLHYQMEQYDKDGRVTLRTVENFKTKEYDQSVFTFDKDGNMTECDHYDRGGKITAEETYENQLLYSKVIYEGGKESTAEEYHYTADGQFAYILEFDYATQQTLKIVYNYNSAQNLTSIETFTADGTILEKQEFSKGILTRLVTYADGELRSFETYEYDDQGRKVVTLAYLGDGSLDTRTVYYYLEDDSSYYLIYDADGILIFDSLGGNHPDEPNEDPESTDTDTDTETDSSATTDTAGSSDTTNTPD